MKNYAIILASGTGSRFGGNIPKQFTKTGGKTILETCVEVFENSDVIDKVIVVITPGYMDSAQKILNPYKKIENIVEGGAIRKESSYIGVSSVKEKEANVFIHDCARPFVSLEIIKNCARALEKYSAVCTAVPVVDTILKAENKKILEVPKRELFYRAQTPQCFRLSLIKRAHEVSRGDTDFTDDCGMVLKYGLSEIVIADGDTKNIKVTYPEDV